MYLDKFIEFLEFIRDKKKTCTFNNMENNLYKALKCNSTLTELVVLDLYAQAISHPYIQYIHTPGKDLNMLDLEPLHNEVLIHIQQIINTPDLLVGSKVSHTNGALQTYVHTPDSRSKMHIPDLLFRAFITVHSTFQSIMAAIWTSNYLGQLTYEQNKY